MPVKSTVEISQNFVALSEYMNFNKVTGSNQKGVVCIFLDLTYPVGRGVVCFLLGVNTDVFKDNLLKSFSDVEVLMALK